MALNPGRAITFVKCGVRSVECEIKTLLPNRDQEEMDIFAESLCCVHIEGSVKPQVTINGNEALLIDFEIRISITAMSGIGYLMCEMKAGLDESRGIYGGLFLFLIVIKQLFRNKKAKP